LLIGKIAALKLIEPNQVLTIKVFTTEEPNEFCSINLKKLQQKFKNKSIVIFVAQEDDRKFLIYWKSKDIRQILFLSSYRDSFNELDKSICEFAADFLVSSLQSGYLGEIIRLMIVLLLL
jgi:hypothetical protein